jgi:hypothetical protein
MALGWGSASNRNEYQEYFLWGEGGRCLGLANLPVSNLEPSGPVIGLYRDCL